MKVKFSGDDIIFIELNFEFIVTPSLKVKKEAFGPRTGNERKILFVCIVIDMGTL